MAATHEEADLTKDGPSFTIPQFCTHYQISRPFYYDLKKRGLGPIETRLGKAVRILHRSRMAWEVTVSAPDLRFAAQAPADPKLLQPGCSYASAKVNATNEVPAVPPPKGKPGRPRKGATTT